MRVVDDATRDIAGLGLLPRILFATDGAISHIIEADAGERIDLTRMTSGPVTDPLERLDVGLGGAERGLRRRSLLRPRS